MYKIIKAMGMYPWAIVESELNKIITIASRSSDIEALAKKDAAILDNTHKTEIRDGIAEQEADKVINEMKREKACLDSLICPQCGQQGEHTLEKKKDTF